MNNEGLIIEDIAGICPCQAEGTMDGFPFCFRIRHGSWELDVVSPGCDAADASTWGDSEVYRAGGINRGVGYVSSNAVVATLQRAYASFRTWPDKPHRNAQEAPE